MKKLFLGLVAALVLSTGSLFAGTSDDVFSSGSISVSVHGGYALVYDRAEYSVKNQSETDLYKKLQKGICSNESMKKHVINGSEFYFIYLYKDGVISLSITDCY